jgi:hypothetical protein
LSSAKGGVSNVIHRASLRYGDSLSTPQGTQKYGFPSGRVFARADGQSYGQIAAREMPDVLIEDNCESIGPDQITYLQIRPGLRSRIKSIIVPEFGGIDHLPNASHLLLTFES